MVLTVFIFSRILASFFSQFSAFHFKCWSLIILALSFTSGAIIGAKVLAIVGKVISSSIYLSLLYESYVSFMGWILICSIVNH